MEGKSRRKDRVTAVVLLGFSLIYFFSSLRLKVGTTHNPGPGFIPAVIGGLLLLCATFYLIGVFRITSPEAGAPDIRTGKEKNYRAIIGIIACTTVYPFILEILKFTFSTAAVAFAMLVLLRPQRPVFSFFLALGLSVGFFLVFSRLLGVALPSGFLEDFLFRVGG